MTDTRARTCIIAGMHRSGTSVTAAVLQSHGLPIGDELMEATPSNARGYFEDLRFYQLNEAILADNRASVFSRKRLRVALERREAARRLTAGRPRVWGWKDPRNTLLLPFWTGATENPVVIAPFRPAEEVVDSLFHRASDRPLKWRPWLAPLAWVHYNRILAMHARSHRCLLFQARRVVESPDAVVAAANERFDLNLTAAAERPAVEPGLFNSGGLRHAAKVRLWCRPFRRTIDRLWRELLALEQRDFGPGGAPRHATPAAGPDAVTSTTA